MVHLLTGGTQQQGEQCHLECQPEHAAGMGHS